MLRQKVQQKQVQQPVQRATAKATEGAKVLGEVLLILVTSVGGASEGPYGSYRHVWIRVGASFVAARFSPRQVIKHHRNVL